MHVDKDGNFRRGLGGKDPLPPMPKKFKNQAQAFMPVGSIAHNDSLNQPSRASMEYGRQYTGLSGTKPMFDSAGR